MTPEQRQKYYSEMSDEQLRYDLLVCETAIDRSSQPDEKVIALIAIIKAELNRRHPQNVVRIDPPE